MAIIINGMAIDEESLKEALEQAGVFLADDAEDDEDDEEDLDEEEDEDALLPAKIFTYEVALYANAQTNTPGSKVRVEGCSFGIIPLNEESAALVVVDDYDQPVYSVDWSLVKDIRALTVEEMEPQTPLGLCPPK